MRNLFYALLFLNLAFLAWGHWADKPRVAPGVVAAMPAVPTLELVKIAPAGAPGSASATSNRCRSIGPFADASSAASASDALRAHGWAARDRDADTTVSDGYWVYIGQLTAAAQRTVLARLNAAGIHDAASMTQPEQSDRVSVGFFSDQTHAVRRAEQVRQLGFKPVLDLHQRTVSAHWLDVDLKPSDPDLQPKQFQGNAAPAGGAPLQVADCPAKAAAG